MATNFSAKPQGRPRVNTAGYEKRDANVKWIFGIVAFVAAAGLVMHFLIAGYQERLAKVPPPTDQWQPSARSNQKFATPPPFPRLQISPAEDLKTFRAREDAELNSYGWVNRTAGVAHIPITRAMDLLLQRGLPTRTNEESKTGASSFELQQQRPLQRERSGE
jgi:hypothetical protein